MLKIQFKIHLDNENIVRPWPQTNMISLLSTLYRRTNKALTMWKVCPKNIFSNHF